MKKDLNEFISFIKFSMVGVVNTLVNWITFFILSNIGIYYIAANIIAYSIATTNSYFWNSKWVFKYEKGSTIKSSFKFILLNLFGLALNTSILYLLVDFLNLKKILALIIATGVTMIINYFINKLWVFKSNLSTNI